MSKALIAGINQVATDKGLDREVIFQAIEAALISAYKRNYGSIANVSSEVDRVTGEMRVYAEREVVEEELNERTEITLEKARKLYPDTKLGDVVKVESKPDDFGRIAAQTAKQVILQRIREAERDTVFENFAHRVGEVINAQVRSTDNASGAVTVMLDEKHEALLMREEQIPNERLRRGDYVKVYVVDVHKSTRGPVIKLSRTHRNLLRRLMEQEIPEVRDGTVEIKAIAREPGARSKAAVVATVPGVDPVGSCVGMRGLRIQNIVNELAGEKIDVVEWSTEVQSYIANALSPAKVNSVYLDETGSIKTAIVVVPDRQLSLAIGKEGQNARLAAKLTGWRIDIKSESEAMKEGLDRLAAEQAQQSRAVDLFSVVERFLQDEEPPTIQPPLGEDLLSKAARALEEMEGRAAESAGEGELPVEMPELPVEHRDFSDFWPAEGFEVPELPVTEALEPEEEAEAVFEAPVEELPSVQSEETLRGVEEIEEKEGEEEVTRIHDLPQVITADMLRARKAQGRERSLDEIEIPAELLIGLDEEEETLEEWDEEEESRKKGRGPAKPKGKGKPVKKSTKPEPKAKGKKWRPAEDDDEFGGRF
ncbi:MAG: transcription termination/antitermination protein NusA [Chloroflexi bacterium]|nr:MAG: transcription termination/antitermination protein NusA [Chloroflexota bacterium]